MIDDKRILAIVPARGGSKGVPRKNVRELAGKPLIAWTIDEARKSKYIDSLILSSEDREIIEVAKSYNCEVPFIRPAHLAKDTTPSIDPVLHAINEVKGYDYVLLLQPTSPLRLVKDIDQIIEKCHQNNGLACVSVTESDQNPYWMYKINNDSSITSFMNVNEIPLRRQEAPSLYALNGAVYISTVEALKTEKAFLQTKTIAYVMPQERSFDIDTELDFKVCEMLLREKSV